MYSDAKNPLCLEGRADFFAEKEGLVRFFLPLERESAMLLAQMAAERCDFFVKNERKQRRLIGTSSENETEHLKTIDGTGEKMVYLK